MNLCQEIKKITSIIYFQSTLKRMVIFLSFPFLFRIDSVAFFLLLLVIADILQLDPLLWQLLI